MAFCPNCGNELYVNDDYCPYCGHQLPKQNDEGSTFLYAFIGFIFPIVGFILYFVFKNDFPKKANSSLKGALVSIIVSVVFSVLAMLLSFGIIFMI